MREPDRPTADGDAINAALDAVQRLARRMLEREGRLPQRAPVELPPRFGLAATGRPFEEVVAALDEIMASTPSSASPLFFNQLFAGRDPAAVMAEMLTPLANTSMYTFKVAGPQVLIEREVLGRMAAAAGFADGEGSFFPGGSISNLGAMVVARDRVVRSARDDGLSGELLTVYTSELGHYSIQKNAGLLGIGRCNVRAVPADEIGRMRVDALVRMLEEDRGSGRVPIMINATAGTTVLGAFDPIRAVAEVAEEHGVWLHVDGALGASVLLCKGHRSLMDGIERADSLTWNVHKMMGVPLVCSALLLRRPGLLADSLSEPADYLFQADEDELNPGTRSIQCGRRNDALKVWAAWFHHGDEGFDRRIARLFELAQHTAALVAADPDMELALHPASINVCFEVRGRSSAAICARLDDEARLKIGHGVANGRRAIRLVCVDPDLEEERIAAALHEIKAVARDLPEGDNAV